MAPTSEAKRVQKDAAMEYIAPDSEAKRVQKDAATVRIMLLQRIQQRIQQIGKDTGELSLYSIEELAALVTAIAGPPLQCLEAPTGSVGAYAALISEPLPPKLKSFGQYNDSSLEFGFSDETGGRVLVKVTPLGGLTFNGADICGSSIRGLTADGKPVEIALQVRQA